MTDRDRLSRFPQYLVGPGPARSRPTQHQVTFPQLLQHRRDLRRQCFGLATAGDAAHLIKQNVSVFRVENLLPIMQNLDVIRRGAVRPGNRHRRKYLASLVQARQRVMNHAKCFPTAIRANVSADGPASAHGPASV